MELGYHEEGLSDFSKDMHRALASAMEELEAVDWYNQRMEVATNPELRDILEHNRDEEIEHACMMLEWLRRHVPAFDEKLRTYLFTDAPLVQVEEIAEGKTEATTATSADDSSLGLGKLA